MTVFKQLTTGLHAWSACSVAGPSRLTALTRVSTSRQASLPTQDITNRPRIAYPCCSQATAISRSTAKRLFSSSAHRSTPRHAGQSGDKVPAAPPTLDPHQVTATKSEKSQAQTDWRIVMKLAENIWPRNSPKTKIRVLGALALLVGGKVLNVQVPFFFKDIVDSLNVPITSSTTVWVLAGTAIAGCECPVSDFRRSCRLTTVTVRRCCESPDDALWRIEERSFRIDIAACYQEGR